MADKVRVLMVMAIDVDKSDVPAKELVACKTGLVNAWGEAHGVRFHRAGSLDAGELSHGGWDIDWLAEYVGTEEDVSVSLTKNDDGLFFKFLDHPVVPGADGVPVVMHVRSAGKKSGHVMFGFHLGDGLGDPSAVNVYVHSDCRITVVTNPIQLSAPYRVLNEDNEFDASVGDIVMETMPEAITW